MKQKLMTIFSRTPVCVGAGNSVGAIDLPIMRERHTRIPLIPGSSVKGVLRDLWSDDPEKDDFFGKCEKSGKLFVGEARVLAFPVRSARNMYTWVTSPLALERFKRDAGMDFAVPEIKEDMTAFAAKELQVGETGEAVFEEYAFTVSQSVPTEIIEAFQRLSSDPVWAGVATHLAIVSDEMFSYFVENACEVPSRIQIDDKTGTVKKGALFCQEQVPSETFFYSVLMAQDPMILDHAQSKINAAKILQFGGDETIGLGYCSVEML